VIVTLTPRLEVEELISQSIDAFWWCKVVEYTDYRSSLSHAEVVFDRDSDWFFLRLNSFSLSAESDVEFEYIDSVDDAADLGSIQQSSVSAENFSHKFSSPNLEQIFTQKTDINVCIRVVGTNIFLGN
jgi:hypothetical protein